MLLLGLFIGVGQFGVLFVAMNTGLPAGLASVIAPLQPVFTIPFAVIALGERPSLRQVFGVSLAIAGLGTIALGRANGVPLQAVALGSGRQHRGAAGTSLREQRDHSGRSRCSSGQASPHQRRCSGSR